MNDRLVQQQTEELERKLRAYERLIEKLPFPFMFTDYETGITIEKRRGDVQPRLSPARIAPGKETEWQWDIDLYRDVPFEKVEAFLTPLLDLVPHHIVSSTIMESLRFAIYKRPWIPASTAMPSSANIFASC